MASGGQGLRGVQSPSLADQIDALLPQTQCTKCGYAGCRPYAEAIAVGDAQINQCPPGGRAGIHKLAQLLSRAALPLNPANGIEQPIRVAVIDEGRCIGCTLCLPACPVGAIVGAARRMHTVIASHCTGCDLCLPPCPMDCITLVPVPARVWTDADANAARRRYSAQQVRRVRAAEPTVPNAAIPALKAATVAAAIERARERRAAGS
ncbi:MAG: RnfABCDGE type electron transport complex subunit B [Burkholderiaceae bacterium]|nr:RnfABCDGE type electron transport complex subunit B [Burkholderiaceae bacterium]